MSLNWITILTNKMKNQLWIIIMPTIITIIITNKCNHYKYISNWMNKNNIYRMNLIVKYKT